MTTKRVKLFILSLYLLWVVVFVLSITKSPSLVVFFYLVVFQFFVPGLVLGLSFGLSKCPLLEIILYGFIISYLIFLLASLPTLFFPISWPFFIGINVFLYFLVLLVFFVKTCRHLSFNFKKPEPQEFCVLALGVLILLSYTFINYRNDATFYNHIVSTSLEAEQVEHKIYNLKLNDDGKLSEELINYFQLNYVKYFNFLALPLKYSMFDQRYAWLIYSKLFGFLSILGVYSLGRRLLNPTCGYLSVFFYLVTVFPLTFYYFYPESEIGILFMQSAHAKQVTQFIFLFAFYNTIITAFRNQSRKSFIFAGAILLSVLTIHQLSFVYAVFNYIMFSLVIIVFSAYHTRKIYPEVIKILKNSLYVASLPILYFVYLLASSDYYNEYIYYQTVWSKAQWDGAGAMAIKNWVFYDKLKSLSGRAKILIDTSLILGIPFWIIKLIKKRLRVSNEFSSMFLLSNLVLYLLLKFPLFNTLIKLDFPTGQYIDSLLLSYFILAFIIAYILKNVKFNFKMSGFNYTVILLTALIYIFLGTNNVFAIHFRAPNRIKLAGDAYLKMTEYLNSIKRSSGSGVTVLTNMKSSIDIYAFLNAYIFQLEGATLYPYTLNRPKVDEIDELIFYPHKNVSKVNSFIKDKRVDYIVLPTVNTPWVKEEQAEDNRQAIEFYNKFPGYQSIYSDAYYHVYEQIELPKG